MDVQASDSYKYIFVTTHPSFVPKATRYKTMDCMCIVCIAEMAIRVCYARVHKRADRAGVVIRVSMLIVHLVWVTKYGYPLLKEGTYRSDVGSLSCR